MTVEGITAPFLVSGERLVSEETKHACGKLAMKYLPSSYHLPCYYPFVRILIDRRGLNNLGFSPSCLFECRGVGYHRIQAPSFFGNTDT